MATVCGEATRAIGIGILGAGGAFGRFIASAITQIDGAYLAAVGGTDTVRVEQARRDLGAPAAYLDPAALIADPAVDLVVISTPPSLHAEQGIAAARAGKAILIEKPVATRWEDALALQRAVDESGVACVVDYVMRYNSLFDVLKEWTDAELFGRLRRIDFQNFAGDESLLPEHWFWDRTLSGGILIEHGVHFFDIYGSLAGGPPAVVRGMLTTRTDPPGAGGVEQEDKVLAEVLYESGVLASYYHAFAMPSRLERTEALLAYDRGYVTVEGWIAMTLRLDAIVDEAGYERLQETAGLRLATVEQYEGEQRRTRGHGYDKEVTRRVRGELSHPFSKEEVYRGQVRAALEDLLRAMADPGHRPRATLAEGLQSLDVAVRATADGARLRHTPR